VKKKMGEFLKEYCGLSGGKCNCKKRVGYAIASHRLEPSQLEYSVLKKLDGTVIDDYIRSMEHMDSLALLFADMPKYKATKTAREFILNLMKSSDMQLIQNINN
jgi:hypothetical protein